MIYTLNDNELRQIAEVYGMDIELLAKKLELEDAVINFLPHKKGIKLSTKAGQNFTLFFKDGLKF